MLREYLAANPTEMLTTYTRNPAILRMIGSLATSVFPLDDNQELREIAEQFPPLLNKRNALIVAAHIDQEKRS